MAHSVMIVEDDDDNALLMEKILNKKGYEITRFADGESAVKYCSDHKPELILMDVTLPGIDGFKASEQIKGEGSATETPIVIISAHPKEEIQDKVNLTHLDYLSKPYTPDQLRNTVDRYFQE